MALLVLLDGIPLGLGCVIETEEMGVDLASC